MARCPLVLLLHPSSLGCPAEQRGIGGRVWLELGERGLFSAVSSPVRGITETVKWFGLEGTLKMSRCQPVGRSTARPGPGCCGRCHTPGTIALCRFRDPHRTGGWKKQGMCGCGHSLGWGSGVLIHNTEHSLVSSSQKDPSENENLKKNRAKALEGNCEGRPRCQLQGTAQRVTDTCEESFAVL